MLGQNLSLLLCVGAKLSGFTAYEAQHWTHSKVGLLFNETTFPEMLAPVHLLVHFAAKLNGDGRRIGSRWCLQVDIVSLNVV